jgi:hypothetical protein
LLLPSRATVEEKMNRPGVLRVLLLSLVLVVFGCSAEFAFAGVHGGGGGGFHGGGGGWHGGGGGGWHGGGGGYNGWHGGGGYSGWHGGYGGWHGGYGGYYGGWGWGWPWGFGVSLNFGWPYYGYPYAYSYPYYYPYYPNSYYAPSSGPTGYSDPAPPAQASGSYQNSAPLRQPAPPSNSVTLHEAVYRRPAANYGAAMSGASYRPASADRQLPSMRPEVRNVIRALRAMPPQARRQQIDSGRYSDLSPQELKLVRDAAGLPSGDF